MEGGLCSLKWKNRMDHLQAVYLEFFQKELLCDVTLVTGKDRFKAHFFVLCAFSPYFKDMLTSVTPGQYPVIFLKGTTSQEVKWLLDYLYTGEVVIPVDSVEQFLSFGESLGVMGLCEGENQDPNSSSENFVTPDINNSQSFIESNDQTNVSFTPDLVNPVITSHTTITHNKRAQENCKVNGAKRPKIDEGSSINKELNQVLLPNQITPDPSSPIITSHIIIAPNKKAQEKCQADNGKRPQIYQCSQNELSTVQLSLSQEELDPIIFNSVELESINFFDESNLLSSPPRPCSVIFNIDDDDRMKQNETQESVIFQENESDVVEISDDESQVEHILDKTAIVNENQGDGSSNVQCVIPVVSQPQVESDDSEIEIIRRTDTRSMISECNSFAPNIDMNDINKELRVVLNRCTEDH